MNHKIHDIFNKLTWFNNLNSTAVYKLPVIAKEQLSNFVFVEEFLKKYDRYYIHNKKCYVGTGKGLWEVISEPTNGIISYNFTDLLVRGYTHDFRIIIYVLLSMGFTLWFNSNPVHIPQIELYREIVQQPYVYTIIHSILTSTNHMRIEPTKCLLKKIPSILTPSTEFDFDSSTTIVKYIKHHYYPGWSELKHMRPEELVKSMLLNERIQTLLGSLLGSLTFVFNPLDIVEKSAEDVGKLLEDYSDTAKGRKGKRVKSQVISIAIIILLMTLVESPPASIPC